MLALVHTAVWRRAGVVFGRSKLIRLGVSHSSRSWCIHRSTCRKSALLVYAAFDTAFAGSQPEERANSSYEVHIEKDAR